MRVAYYSPLPPARSGIADYSALLLPALRERLEEVVVAQPGKRAPRADICLYHVGNDPDSHGWIIDALRERPGVVVLHELVLHHLIAGITIGRGNGRGYMEAMERDYGVVGRLLALGVLDNLLPLIWETQPERFPLTGTVLDLARGLIVHSAYVERGVRDAGYGGPLWRIPHAAWPDEAAEAADLSGDPLIGCFGHQNMNKRIPPLLEAFTLLRRRRPGARLLLVGIATERFDLDRRARAPRDRRRRADPGGIRQRGAVPVADGGLRRARQPPLPDDGRDVRARSSVASRSASRSSSPTSGWFSELPDDAVLKIPVDDYEVATSPARSSSRPITPRRSVPPPAPTSTVSTTSAGLPTPTSPRSKSASGGEAATDAVPRPYRRGGRRDRARRSSRARTRCARGRSRLSAVTAVRARAVAVPARVWLAAIVVCSIVVRVALAHRIVAPWIMVDEIVYSELAKNVRRERAVSRPRPALARLRLRLPAADRAGLAACSPRCRMPMRRPR